jgi:regulator of RNase E activity RraB
MVKFSELIFDLATSGSIPISLCVEEHRYTKEYEEMEKISMELHDFLKKGKEHEKKEEKEYDSYRAIYRLSCQVEKLIDYSKILNQKVYLSSYSDKYGNSFLQARTSLKDAFGKTKWISAYLGSIQNFDKGDKDPIALKKGKELIREKLRAFYKL